MANQQGHATDQGRRRQQRQQVTRHNRAEHNAQPANCQEDEGVQRETSDEDADGLVRGPLMRPMAAQPLFYIPPSNAPVYLSMLSSVEAKDHSAALASHTKGPVTTQCSTLSDFKEGHGDVQQSTAAEEPIQHEQHYGEIATLGTMFIRGMVSGSATPCTPQ
ncbi:hypothetical protein MRX96_003327 [Rhipicephalus microplus]